MAITDKLSAIADAIRAKTGESGTMKLEQMPGKIAGISTGITPSGNINITDTQQTDVTNYATAQVVDANLTAENIASGVTVLGIVGTHQGGGGELPQLHAPTISIVEDTLTITNPSTNGDFVTAFGGYANGVSVGAIPVSSNPLDLTSLGFPAGDYTLTATCKGTNFAESEQSNSLAYTNIFYNVSSVLVGCSSNNSAATVRRGNPYTATISALAGYKLLGATVTVTMGGEDITATAYTYSNKQGLISIESASGEIAISVTAAVDAVQFTSRSLPANITIYSGLQPHLLCFNAELWITAMESNSYDGFCKSTDGGKTWTFIKSDYLTKLFYRTDMEPIITNGSSLVGYDLKNITSDSAYYSMDGNTFTKKSAPDIRYWWASGDLYFYAPANKGVYVTSDITADGVKTGLGVRSPSAKMDIIKYVNGTHFYMQDRLNTASTANTTVYYSSAAFDTNKNASWDVAKIIPNGYSYGDVADLTYADNAYYAVTDTGKIIKVTNFAIGGTKIADLDSTIKWGKIEYNGENFVAVPETGKKYAVSSDGVSWTYGELNYDEALNDLKVVGGKFVLLGATKIYTSE